MNGCFFGNDLLHPVHGLLSLRIAERAGLAIHHPVDLGFPRGGGRFLRWIPLVVGRGAEPDIHHGVGIGIDIFHAQQACLVVLRCA